MTPSNYTSITTLLADINTQLAALTPRNGSNVVLSYELVNNNIYKVRATWAGATGNWTFKMVYNPSLYMYRMGEVLLGFTVDQVSSGTTLTARNAPNLNPDNYYNLSIYSNQLPH